MSTTTYCEPSYRMIKLAVMAQDYAHKCGSSIITAEHYWFALLSMRDDCNALRIMLHAGCNVRLLRADAFLRPFPVTTEMPRKAMPQQPEAKAVVQRACARAQLQSVNVLSTEYLLLGFLGCETPWVRDSMARAGVTEEALLKAMAELHLPPEPVGRPKEDAGDASGGSAGRTKGDANG
jgi:ATP-dependent Clp protease ATP-binding subunit ClpA